MENFGKKIKIACVEAAESVIKLGESLRKLQRKEYTHKSKYHK
jgi:hypothetical protein